MNIGTLQSRLQRDQRQAFTLVELLVVIAIITLVASMTLFALAGVREDARERRARTQVAKIHEVLTQQWESYRTRPVPVTIPANAPLKVKQRLRLGALRQLMRVEMPDRKTDLMAPFPALGSTPSIWRSYVRRANRQSVGNPNNFDGWTPEHEHAECLYLILASIRDGDTTGLEYFTESEIGDADGDGMPEILDPWGTPIYFLRTAAGFRSDIQHGDMEPGEDGNAGTGNGDPFDPLKADSRWDDSEPNNDPFVLFPLVVSAGRDRQFGMLHEFSSLDQNTPSSPYVYDDPYAIDPNEPSPPQISLPQIGQTTGPAYADDITSHFVEVR